MPNEIDYYSPPLVPWEKLEATYLNPELVLVVHEIMKTEENFTVIFQDLLDIMKYKFEIEEYRKKKILIRFTMDEAEKPKAIEIRHLISNMILWRPFIEMDKVELLGPDHIFDFTEFNVSALMKYMNEKILKDCESDFATQNSMINDICHSITNVSHAFCLLMGMGVSLYDIHQIELRNPEAAEIMHGAIDPSLEPEEIEKELSARTSRLIDIIAHDTGNNDMKPLFASGSGIKPAQFKELVVKIGFKADLNGNTIPMLINSSFLMEGLNKPSYYYINAMSGRKAAILAKIAIGKPGAFSKKLSQVVTPTGYLSDTTEPCDSITPIHYHIKDDKFLKLLNGRYYYDSRGRMHYLDYERDKHLIGRVVDFRSPITCTGHDGVCPYCYGHLYGINNSMFSPGVLASLKLTEPLSQGVLSAKHSQTTHSNAIQFDESFQELFELNSTEINLRDDANPDEELFLKLSNVHMEEFDDSEFYFVTGFDIINRARQVVYHIAENNGAKMYLNQDLVARYKHKKNKATASDTCIIPLDDFDDDSSLFTIEVKNQELTDPIKVFESILNRKDHAGAKTISDLCQIFAEALMNMGVSYDLVHAEMVIRALVRKRSNIMEMPDFSAAGNPSDWQITRLNDALLYHPSALVSMPYGYLRKQLLSPELYEKDAPSHLDALFVSDLSQYI
ncbi:MAG: hypothetical protein NC548_06080 [Lachnospiraceae bacterium]|nr:hypothetical protein [Lachnospiraceae bacterium]